MTNNNQELLVKNTFTITAIVALFGIVLFVVFGAFDVWLLVFAGILLATFINGTAMFVQGKTKWKPGVSKVVAIVLVLAVITGTIFLIGAKISEQAKELTEQGPALVKQLQQKLNASPVGKKALALVKKSGGSGGGGMASKIFSSTFGVLGDLYSVLFIGLFLTVSPSLYKKGIIMLMPVNAKAEAESVYDKMGNALRQWLKGTLISMLIVAVLTGIGLAAMGIKLWLILALLTGILCFIPNIGPILSMIPAVLIGFSEGGQKPWLIIGLYVLVQTIESNFITPFIQKKLLDVPPALILIIQMVMGAFSGSWGLVMATPLLVVLMVVIQELYINRQPIKNAASGGSKKVEKE